MRSLEDKSCQETAGAYAAVQELLCQAALAHKWTDGVVEQLWGLAQRAEHGPEAVARVSHYAEQAHKSMQLVGGCLGVGILAGDG